MARNITHHNVKEHAYELLSNTFNAVTKLDDLRVAENHPLTPAEHAGLARAKAVLVESFASLVREVRELDPKLMPFMQ